MNRKFFRGSRKHILDLVSRRDFIDTFNDLLKDSGASVSTQDVYQPKGYADPTEMELRDLGPLYLPDDLDWTIIRDWWPSLPAKSPQWDLLITCTFGNKRGLVLVEAKANESELKWEGKNLEEDCSPESLRNHERIGENIANACKSLNQKISGVNIQRDSHYQLSNRITFSWKLAQCSMPVVLLYLGFIGDTGIADVGIPFRDHNHWQRVMGAYLHGILPQTFPETRIEFENGGPMIMLIHSLPIKETSPTKN